MNNKGSVLMITLWILTILVMFAVGLGHRALINLRLGRYQRDRLKASLLAKSGINRAILELENDKNEYDTLRESWRDNKSIFEKVLLGGRQDEFASVSYVVKDGETEEVKFGAVDEEAKINLNNATKEQLTFLLKECGVEVGMAEKFSSDILIWRGSLPASNDISSYYEDNLGYPLKGKKFASLEELILVKGASDLEKDKLDRFKDSLTIYSNNKVNINTVSKETLKMLGLLALSADPSLNEDDLNPLVDAIFTFRVNDYFKPTELTKDAMKDGLKLIDDKKDANKIKIIEKLIPSLAVKSENFRIQALGKVGNVAKNIACVYNRVSHKTVYWHEN